MSTFNPVADEYYDPERHPTCNNFRRGSEIVLAPWVSNIKEGERIFEVGAGKSLLAEILLHRRLSLAELMITDESESMLGYSRQYDEFGATLMVANGKNLPFQANEFDWLVASLGDPYNEIPFWREVVRVLKPHGQVLFTIPAYPWAKAFRSPAKGADLKQAEFELRDGRRILMPSFIYPEPEQQAMIEQSGLMPVEVRHATIADLGGQQLSPKLCLDRGPEGRVVTGYRSTKIEP